MENKKNRPLEDLVPSLVKMYEKNDCMLLRDDKITLKKKLTLKAIWAKKQDRKLQNVTFFNPNKKIELIHPQKFNNPVKVLRFMDYCMPLDSSFLLAKSDPSKCIDFNILGAITEYKRVTKMQHLDNKFNFSVEEKWASPNKLKGIENFRYVSEYLKSLGDKTAFVLSQELDIYIDYCCNVSK